MPTRARKSQLLHRADGPWPVGQPCGAEELKTVSPDHNWVLGEGLGWGGAGDRKNPVSAGSCWKQPDTTQNMAERWPLAFPATRGSNVSEEEEKDGLSGRVTKPTS